MCSSCDKKANRDATKKINKKKNKDNKCSEDESEKMETPKCPSPKHPHVAKPKKCLTKLERVMLRIQPPIEDRERYLNPRHVNCFLEESERVHVDKKPICKPCPPVRRKVCAAGKTKKQPTNDAKTENDKDDNKVKDKTNTEEVDDEESGIENETDASNEENTKPEAENRESQGKGESKKNEKRKKRKKASRKKQTKKISSSETSICSVDSEVCLVGLALTREDKKKIEENRRKVHPPPDKEDKTVKDNEDAKDAVKQEDEEAGKE